MNYRHRFHAGNFADVLKHVVLIRLIRSLQQKPRGIFYLDTHAGAGRYDLADAERGDSLERAPEWPDGIGRLWTATNVPAPVAEYLELVRKFDHAQGNVGTGPRFFPGSPCLAAMLARRQDRLAFCEAEPSECEALRRELRSTAGPEAGHCAVHEMDGYVAIRALLPPSERRALVLIDPPYEEQGEYSRAVSGLADGLRRSETAVFAIWYPLTGRARAQEFHAAVVALDPPPTLIAELAIAGDDSARNLKGCGLAIVNPPWRFDEAALSILESLGRALSLESGGGRRIDWLVRAR